MKKPEIKYPLNWQYKIIGTDKTLIIKDVKKIIDNRVYTIEDSKSSSKGKYLSLNLSLVVNSENERKSIFQQLSNSENIRIVI